MHMVVLVSETPGSNFARTDAGRTFRSRLRCIESPHRVGLLLLRIYKDTSVADPLTLSLLLHTLITRTLDTDPLNCSPSLPRTQSWGKLAPSAIPPHYRQELTQCSISRDWRHKRSATGAKRATYRKKRYA